MSHCHFEHSYSLAQEKGLASLVMMLCLHSNTNYVFDKFKSVSIENVPWYATPQE